MKRSASRVLWVGSSLVMALTGACAHEPQLAPGAWKAHETPNARVYSATLLEHRAVQEWVETSAYVFRSTFFRGLASRPLEVMFLPSPPGALTRFNYPNDNPPGAWALETMPGGGRIGHDGLIVLSDRHDLRGAARQEAYQLINQAIPNAPMWLRVGLTEYLAGYRVHYNNQAWVACFGHSWGMSSAAQVFRDGGSVARGDNPGWREVLLPIDDVLAADWFAYADGGQHWFTYTSHAFVSYLIHGQPGWGAQRFFVMLRALAEGKTSQEAIATAYPNLLFDEIDEALSRYTHLPQRRHGWTSPDGLCSALQPDDAVEKAGATSPVRDADVQAALDDLQRMPMWHEPESWYPTEALLARSGVLKRTPVPADSSAPETRSR